MDNENHSNEDSRTVLEVIQEGLTNRIPLEDGEKPGIDDCLKEFCRRDQNDRIASLDEMDRTLARMSNNAIPASESEMRRLSDSMLFYSQAKQLHQRMLKVKR